MVFICVHDSLPICCDRPSSFLSVSFFSESLTPLRKLKISSGFGKRGWGDRSWVVVLNTEQTEALRRPRCPDQCYCLATLSRLWQAHVSWLVGRWGRQDRQRPPLRGARGTRSSIGRGTPDEGAPSSRGDLRRTGGCGGRGTGDRERRGGALGSGQYMWHSVFAGSNGQFC